MSIHFHSLEPAIASVETLQSNAGSSRSNLGTEFRTLIAELETQSSSNSVSKTSSGLAAADAASVEARTAATAAAVSGAASTSSAVTAATTATTAASGSTTTATTTSTTSTSTAATSDPKAVLTAEDVFGANPWLTNPTGSCPNGQTFGYNPIYFATANTAEEVAKMVGGTVVQDDEFTKNTPGDPFVQQQANEMVELPDGALINPGLIASLYTHGYPQSMVNQSIAAEVASAEASVTSTET